jgi:hypothetical protein
MLANNIANVINQRMKSMGISSLFPDRFFIFSPERCDGNWKTILRILGSRAFSHSLDPKPKSSRGVCPLCAPMAIATALIALRRPTPNHPMENEAIRTTQNRQVESERAVHRERNVEARLMSFGFGLLFQLQDTRS